MTLVDYINQKAPQRLPIGSVVLEENDYTIVGRLPNLLRIQIINTTWCYVIKAGEKHCFTSDEHGNPKSISVFRIK